MPFPERFRRLKYLEDSYLTDEEKAAWNKVFAEVEYGSIFLLTFQFGERTLLHEAVTRYRHGWRYFGPGPTLPLDDLVELQQLADIKLIFDAPR